MPPRAAPHIRLLGDSPQSPLPAPPSARDDSELLACIRAGDDSAAEDLHDRLRPRVEGTVRRLLGRSDPDVEDLVQIAMIEVVTSIDGYRGDSSLEAWAASIAAHVVFRHIRRRRSERQIFASSADEQGDDPRGHTSSYSASISSSTRIAIARDLVDRVRRHLDEIEEVKAYTFLLHDVCGFDLREIAQITEVSVAAAQSRLVRGRREIHERIARDPELSDRVKHTEDDT